MKALSRLLVFPLIAFLALAANAYAQHFARALIFDSQVLRSYQEMITCALIGALAATIVASAPLAAVFRKKAWVAAAIVATPVLALRINELFTYAGVISDQVRVMALVEASSYFGALVLGTWLVSCIWPRPNNSFKPTPLRGAA